MSDKTFTQDEVNKIVQERLDRDRQARVVHEPRTYSADGAHSFYADTILARVLADENAQRRLLVIVLPVRVTARKASAQRVSLTTAHRATTWADRLATLQCVRPAT